MLSASPCNADDSHQNENKIGYCSQITFGDGDAGDVLEIHFDAVAQIVDDQLRVFFVVDLSLRVSVDAVNSGVEQRLQHSHEHAGRYPGELLRRQYLLRDDADRGQQSVRVGEQNGLVDRMLRHAQGLGGRGRDRHRLRLRDAVAQTRDS